MRRLFDELYHADALVAVVTAAYGRSPWCAAEVGVALANGVRVLPGLSRTRPIGWCPARRKVADLLTDAAPASRLLLVVDQAEALLTRTPEALRRQFAELLLEATGGPVRAVATVRSECTPRQDISAGNSSRA